MNIFHYKAKHNNLNTLKLLPLLIIAIFISNISFSQETADKVFDWSSGFEGWHHSSVEYHQLYDGYNGGDIRINDSQTRYPGDHSIRFYVNSLQNLKALPTCPSNRRKHGTLSNGDPCNPATSSKHYTNQRAEIGDAGLLVDDLKVKDGSTLWLGWSEYFDNIDRKRNNFTIQFRSQPNGVPGGPAAALIINNGRLKLYAPQPKNSSYPTAINSGVEIKEKVWYDYVVEIKYSYSTNGRIRVWRKEAGASSNDFTYDSKPLFEFNGYTMFHPDGYPNPNSRGRIDTRPHLRWGVYRDVQKVWYACTQNNINRYDILKERCENVSSYEYASTLDDEYGIVTKYLGTTRLKVGDLGKEGFDAVKPRNPQGDDSGDGGDSGDDGNGGGGDNPVDNGDDNLRNLAPLGNVSQSSAMSNGHPLNAIDGDTSKTYIHSSLEENPWWSIDLGEPYYVENINIWNRIDCCFSDAQNCYIFVSNEPFTSSDIETTLENPAVNAYLLYGPSIIKKSLPIQATGRYFRIQISGKNYLSLGEVEIMGMDEGAKEDNIWIEAECGVIGRSWVSVQNKGASNKEYIYLPNKGLNYRTPPTEAKFIANYDFYIKNSGSHSVYFRYQSSTAEDDSFWVRIDNGNWIQFNNLKKKSNFLWEELHDSQNSDRIVKLELEKGKHTIEVGIREDGTKLDKIFITSTNTVPSGFGDNAGNCSSPTKSFLTKDNSDNDLLNTTAITEIDGAITINPNPTSDYISVDLNIQDPQIELEGPLFVEVKSLEHPRNWNRRKIALSNQNR